MARSFWDAVERIGWVTGSGGSAAPFVDGGAWASRCVSVAPFVAGAGGPCSSLVFTPSAAKTAAVSDASTVASSLTTLSSAGRLASGKSVGAEGEEGSSKGRLAEDIAAVEEGDTDMSRDPKESPGEMNLLQNLYY